MAPRGRPKRIDEVVERMKIDYGIEDVELVKRVTEQLLDVYGRHNEAWSFIQMDNYSVVFEAIISENDKQGNSAGGGDFIECGTAENHAPENEAGPLSVVPEPLCTDVENALENDPKENSNLLQSTERDRKGWRDIGMDENPGSNEEPDMGSMVSRAQLIPTTPLVSSVPTRPDTSPLLSSPLSSMNPPPATATRAAARRRRPCYGWIECDEEDIDLIYLKPAKEIKASSAESREGKHRGVDGKTKRKSRWDMRP